MFQELGGASVQIWTSSVWLPISAILAGPYARIGDHVGRRWPWLIANVLGFLGNILIATAPNIGTVILGVAFWGITFGGAGNTLAAPAEILRKSFDVVSAMECYSVLILLFSSSPPWHCESVASDRRIHRIDR